MAIKFLLALVVMVFTLLGFGGVLSFYPDLAPWLMVLFYPHGVVLLALLCILLLLLWISQLHPVSFQLPSLWLRIRDIFANGTPMMLHDGFARRWQIFLQNQQQGLTPSPLRTDAYTFDYDDGIGVMLILTQDEPLTMAFMRSLLEHILVQRYIVAVLITDQSISIGCRFFAEEAGILLIDHKTFAQTYDCLQIHQLALTRV